MNNTINPNEPLFRYKKAEFEDQSEAVRQMVDEIAAGNLTLKEVQTLAWACKVAEPRIKRRQGADFAEGDLIRIGDNLSPKYLCGLKAHIVWIDPKGTSVEVVIEQETGQKYTKGSYVTIPVGTFTKA